MTGLLYKRNLLFYDRQTDSLWSQLLAQAVTGPLAGTRLHVLPAENTTWGEWKQTHPKSRVLSFATGHLRNYDLDPYADVPLSRNPALLVLAGEKAKIYPFSELKKTPSPVLDRVGDHAVKIIFVAGSDTARVESDDPAAVTSFVAFFGDLKAFYPSAKLYRAPGQ